MERKKRLYHIAANKRVVALALAAGLLAGCAAPASGPDTLKQSTLPGAIALTATSYACDPEEVMYLSGVKVAAERYAYALSDMDGDGISELFVRDAGGTVVSYRYNEGLARRQEGTDIPAELLWVEPGQWADGSVIGVAAQTGDPGTKEDFYLSANYGWLSEEHVSAAGESSSATDELEAAVSARREDMFDNVARYQGADVQRLRDYYALASNWDRRNEDGVEPVKKYLDAVAGVGTLAELSDYLTDPAKDPFCTMLNFTVTLDLSDTSHWATELAEDSFSVLPRVFHNGSAEDVADARYEFEEEAKHVLTRAGYGAETVEQILTDCFEVEDQLLAAAWLAEGEQESDFLPFDEAVAMCKRFPLRRLLNAYHITGGSVRAYFPQYLPTLDGMYTEENLPKLKAYVLAHTAMAACGFLDEEAATFLTGEDRETLERGYRRELLSPRGTLGVAEENAYMTYFAPADVRADLTALAEEIRGAFREILQGEDWMSDAGKAAALEKLDAMTFCVMAPDTLIDSGYLAVDPEGCFLDEYAKIFVSSRRHNGAFAGQERVKGDWRYDLRPEIATTYTNAFYYGSFNQFFILAGFVDDSIYRLDMPREEKLAKLGEIVGHELTHGFDPLGIQYDKDGNKVGTDEHPNGWLPEADYEAFLSRAKRVADYFDAIRPLPYESCDGSTVQGEAIADMGGLSIALKLAGDSFDFDHFFRAYAELWAQQTTLMRERSEIYNEHPLRHLRINTTVQQFDAFYDTYGAGEGDGMYLTPADRILVW